MNKRPINKNNPKNIYCDHCEHYKIGILVSDSDHFKTEHKVNICDCNYSKHFLEERYYWNRCKCFEWKKDANYA